MPLVQLKSAKINYIDVSSDAPNGQTIVLIHGFVSSANVNWVNTGWVKFLNEHGFRVISLDNRGHGESEKFYEEADYSLNKMAGDVVELLARLDIQSAHIMGYSMGARISSMLALNHPELCSGLILAGNGYNMIEGTGDWTSVRDALLAPSLEDVSSERGKKFRAFADQTKGDLKALTACVMGAREMFTESQFASISNKAMIAIGTEDDLAGDGEKLAGIMQNASFLPIPNRDHMRAVGDKAYMQGTLEFLKAL